MKRLLAFFIIGGCLFGLSAFGKFDILSYDKICDVCIVTKEDISKENVIQSGNQFYYSYSLEEAREVLPQIQKVDGVILYFEEIKADEVFSFYHAQSFKGGSVDGNDVFYGYTPYFQDFYYQNNKKVNMQMLVKGEELILGFPAILTGF